MSLSILSIALPHHCVTVFSLLFEVDRMYAYSEFFPAILRLSCLCLCALSLSLLLIASILSQSFISVYFQHLSTLPTDGIAGFNSTEWMGKLIDSRRTRLMLAPSISAVHEVSLGTYTVYICMCFSIFLKALLSVVTISQCLLCTVVSLCAIP